MKKFIIFILISNIYLFSYEKKVPIIEDFQLLGYENTNFLNVLLDPSASIDNFYAITDSGVVYDIQNMGLEPIINNVFEVDGIISEAITYDSSHYLSLNSNSVCYLIKTKDFIVIDTLFSEINAEITDFNIYEGRINIVIKRIENTKVLSKNIVESDWDEIEVEYEGYNRIASLYDNLYLFKYLGEDTNILIYKGESSTWEEREYYNEDISSIAEIKPRDSLLYLCGRYGLNNGSYHYALNRNLEYRRFFVSARGKTTVLDIEFDFDFNWRKNPADSYEIGTSENEEEGAFFNKYIFSGSGEGNKILYPYSTSLNKIKSNENTARKEFVAVGNNGIILIINRGESPVEEERKITTKNSFIGYPNPASERLYIESEKPISHIAITDITGRKLLEQSNTNNYNTGLDLSKFTTGIYFLKVNDQVQKIVVE